MKLKHYSLHNSIPSLMNIKCVMNITFLFFLVPSVYNIILFIIFIVLPVFYIHINIFRSHITQFSITQQYHHFKLAIYYYYCYSVLLILVSCYFHFFFLFVSLCFFFTSFHSHYARIVKRKIKTFLIPISYHNFVFYFSFAFSLQICFILLEKCVMCSAKAADKLNNI